VARRELFLPHAAGMLRRDLHGDIPTELLELCKSSDEVGFTVHFDQDTDAPVMVNVRLNSSHGGGPILALLGCLKAFSLEQFPGFRFVTASSFQGRPDITNRCARFFPKGFDGFKRNFHPTT